MCTPTHLKYNLENNIVIQINNDVCKCLCIHHKVRDKIFVRNMFCLTNLEDFKWLKYKKRLQYSSWSF